MMDNKGSDKMKGYFRGWYYKVQSRSDAAAFIVAEHIGDDGSKSASLQVLTARGAFNVTYPHSEFHVEKERGMRNRVTLGRNVFCDTGIHLDTKEGDISLCGDIAFGALSPIRGDIMGPFRFLPFLECSHTVISMLHTTEGSITVNGEHMSFDGGRGYTEGDRGSSFPRTYAWLHCIPDCTADDSVMLSVADIPIGKIHFTGIIGFVFTGGREYRIATYRGAKCIKARDGHITVRQGKYLLDAVIPPDSGSKLFAPKSGNMARTIKENLTCRMTFRFSKEGRTLLDFASDRASCEYELE